MIRCVNQGITAKALLGRNLRLGPEGVPSDMPLVDVDDAHKVAQVVEGMGNLRSSDVADGVQRRLFSSPVSHGTYYIIPYLANFCIRSYLLSLVIA